MAGGIGGFVGNIIGGAIGPLAPAINALVPGVIDIVKRYVPDPAAQAQIQSELTQKLLDAESKENQALMEVAQAQTAINLAEANNPSIWVSGWRPAAAWCCVFGLAYSFFLQPMFGWFTVLFGAAIGASIPSPPVLNVEVIMGLLTGMLGLGGFRTVEKINGAAAPEQGSPLKIKAVTTAMKR
jgi:hypothetical protein